MTKHVKRSYSHLVRHWKTSTFALFVLLFTVMLYTGKITVTEFAEAIGVAVTIVGLLAKDWDKPSEKP